MTGPFDVTATFDVHHAFGFGNISLTTITEMLVRLAVAGLLGACVAYRPWRRLILDAPPPPTESAQAQTMIAVAGALMVAVIGDSLPRAFGLAGLGAFIRFRSGIKDPRDAAVMFVMIGIGMACGFGATPLAIAAAAFASAVLALFDATGRAQMRRTSVGIELEEPRAALESIQAALDHARFVELPKADAPGTVVVEFGSVGDVDVATILARLELHGVPGVKSVALRED